MEWGVTLINKEMYVNLKGVRSDVLQETREEYILNPEEECQTRYAIDGPIQKDSRGYEGY